MRMLYAVCIMLEGDKDTPTAEKFKMYMDVYREFMSTARGPQAISSTAPARQLPSPPDQLDFERKSDRQMEAPLVRLVAMSAPAETTVGKPKAMWADIYLNPTPMVITDKNKYFVIVGSASSEAEGTRQMEALKAKHPEYDFALYGPYDPNRSFGIMMASWVSKERAEEALLAARKIEKTSFTWACRGTGDEC
jgi:hypothetical protein